MPKIIDVEFGVCARDNEGNELLGTIPIDKNIKGILRGMLKHTRAQFKETEERKKEKFEPAQKYGEKEILWMPLEDENLHKIKTLYDKNNIDSNPGLLKKINSLFYYFSIFHKDDGSKVIGIRRTAQFKGVVTAKARLIRLVDDSLTIAKDDIFKLDNDFDFIVQKNNVLILRPSSLSQIANLNEYIKKTAASALTSISKKIPFISFDNIISYVGGKIRSAKLVASLRSRDDLHLISKEQFANYCDENEIPYEIDQNGMIIPIKGQELGFLQLLDRRRFTAELIKGVAERYEAPNRRGVG